MKKIILIYFIGIFFCFKLRAQVHLNTVISIDDKVTASYNIKNVQLILHKDNISLIYESGRLILKEDDYNFFINYNEDENVILKFSYIQECPFYKEYLYEILIKKKFITEQYFNLTIYNFENYPGLFTKNKGYDFEFKSPIISKSLPKNNKKHIMPVCRW